MPDIIDTITDHQLASQDRIAVSARRAADAIPDGSPGECIECGEDMPRLVFGRCAFCRDGKK